MGKRLALLALVTLLLLYGCAGNEYGAPVSGRAANPHAGFHIVASDDTLYSISWMYGHDYHDVARWNGISSPYHIRPGQKILLTPPRQPTAATVREQPAATKKQPVRPRTQQDTTAYAEVRNWRWPTQGRLLRRFSKSDTGKKGIAIAGNRSQVIVASAAGKVVYSGGGLLRYGKLIIIKHNNTYLSAYAHNDRLLVKEGQTVRAGQKIAEMGSTGTDRNMLHFEIRKDGRPVDPLQYLPRRG